ncbi:MAG: hypothetical protein ACLFQ3_10090, partial [Thiohalorhabdus sp.]
MWPGRADHSCYSTLAQAEQLQLQTASPAMKDQAKSERKEGKSWEGRQTGLFYTCPEFRQDGQGAKGWQLPRNTFV